MPLKGLIFDFDGVIIDSETPEYQTWLDIYAKYNASLPVSAWAAWLGSSNDAFDPVRYLEAQIGLTLDRDALIRQQTLAAANITRSLPPLPGLIQLLTLANQRGLSIAVASSASRDWIVTHLTRLNLLDFFDTICSAEDVTKVKPDPALFNLALQRLHLENSQAVVFEDSPNGIHAARLAGIFTVAVPNSVSRNLDLGEANLVCHSLELFNLDQTSQVLSRPTL